MKNRKVLNAFLQIIVAEILYISFGGDYFVAATQLYFFLITVLILWMNGALAGESN